MNKLDLDSVARLRAQEGPWNDEPDELNFIDEDTGLECYIWRNPYFGSLCGYVIIPEEQWNKVSHIDIDNFDIDVHGGITYSGDNGEKFFIGFDCNHYNDWSPYIMSRTIADSVHVTYKDIDYVKTECRKLARQLKDLMEE